MGLRQALWNRLNGGEPSWVVVEETSNERSRWLADRLGEAGIQTRLRNGNHPRPTHHSALGRNAQTIWVAVLEPDVERARELLRAQASNGPMGPIPPAYRNS